jgi:hypothetical protein
MVIVKSSFHSSFQLTFSVNGARYGDHVVTGADDEIEGSGDALHHLVSCN